MRRPTIIFIVSVVFGGLAYAHSHDSASSIDLQAEYHAVNARYFGGHFDVLLRLGNQRRGNA
jgi:hypothetical protein